MSHSKYRFDIHVYTISQPTQEAQTHRIRVQSVARSCRPSAGGGHRPCSGSRSLRELGTETYTHDS